MAAPLVAQIQVNHQGFAAAGGGGDGGTEKDPQEKRNAANDTKNLASTAKGIKDQVSKTLGINFGISAILKQSQIFTSYIGSIFQLMGALVDVILAPFLPVVIPALRVLGEMIPIVASMSKNIFGVLNWIFNKLKYLFTLGGKIDGLPEGFKTAMKHALAAIILGAFWTRIFGLWGSIGKLITGVGAAFARVFKAINWGATLAWLKTTFPKFFAGASTAWTRLLASVKLLFKPITMSWTALKAMGGGITRLIASLGRILGSSKIVANAVTKLAGAKGLLGRVAGGIASKVGIKAIGTAIGAGARGARFIPGLGIIAEAGYGAYKTVKAYKEHGAQAAFETAALATALVAAQTIAAPTLVGAAAVGAASIGGYYALGKSQEARFTVKVQTGDDPESIVAHMKAKQQDEERRINLMNDPTRLTQIYLD